MYILSLVLSLAFGLLINPSAAPGAQTRRPGAAPASIKKAHLFPWDVSAGHRGLKDGVSRPAQRRGVAAPVPGDADWDDRFGYAGILGEAYAVVADGSDVLIGGRITWAGGARANNIARWNGTSWAALGGGITSDAIDGGVFAVAVIGSDVYAGGLFDTAGGARAASIAKWNGTSWTPLGTGVNGRIRALAVSGGNLIAAGAFDSAGGTAIRNIAKWNGTAWSGIGGGIDAEVYALAVSGNVLYAGGFFDSAGTSVAHNIAKWNGSAWSALGSGTDGPVLSVALRDTNVVAGGYFSTAGGSGCSNIASWNGTIWSPLGLGIDGGVYALAASGSNLYAGGEFGNAGATVADHIAVWNGSAWSAVGGGTDGGVYALAAAGGHMWAGGAIGTAGGVAANAVAEWDGSAWSEAESSGPHHGLNGDWDAAVALSGSDVWVGGQFSKAEKTAAQNVAVWNGTGWTPCGDGTDNGVRAIARSGNTVVAGGGFSQAGGGGANNVASWSTGLWSALGAGTNGEVLAVADGGPFLYASGSFDTAGGVYVRNIALWDGNSWSALGSGTDGTVRALAFSGGRLYAGGDFTSAGGASAAYVAVWDGAAWSALGSGTDGTVSTLACAGNVLYAGGTFLTAGETAASHVAKWDGVSWSALGDGTDGPVSSIAARGRSLFAGGVFNTAGGVPANNVARWSGAGWSSLGSGTDDEVNALAAGPGSVYVVGWFASAGAASSLHFARWRLPEFAASPAPLVFASPPVNSSVTDSIIVRNEGEAALVVDSVLSDLAEFEVSPQTAAIAPGDSQTFFVTFTPASEGILFGNLSFHHSGPSSPDSIPVNNNNSVTFHQSLRDKWNIVSVPLVVADDLKTNLYPLAVSAAWAFTGSYTSFAHLSNGVGYWIKFSGSKTVPITGVAKLRDTISVVAGWNLIGTLSFDIPRTRVVPSGTSLQTAFFGYNQGYVASDTLRAGQGYWIKTSSSGELVLSAEDLSGRAIGTGAALVRSEKPGSTPSPARGRRSARPGTP